MKAKKVYLEPESQKKIERLMLGIYLFHTLSLFVAILVIGWSMRMLIPLVIGIPLLLYMYIKKTRTYAFRAYVTCALLWVNLLIYAFYVTDFISILTSICAICILMGLYCLPNVVYIGSAIYTVMVLYHLFIARTISLSAGENGMRSVMRIFFVYFVNGIVYYFVKLQQESNRKLNENIESLKRAEHSKDDFMANVSHEIRTPVNTICGMSEIALQGALPDETKGYLFGIQTAGRNLLSIVSDILDFSELESGNVSIIEESYNITSVINDIINTANAKNSEKNLELVIDCDPHMPDAMIGDRQKLCRVINNVVDNAIKFTEEGGVVLRMTTRREEYGVNLYVTVEDTGVGIRPDTLEMIFSSFTQANTKRNRTEGGIGLGLPICKAIVAKMGGFIHVSSVYGEGTKVSIAIPQQVEDNAPCIVVKEPERIRILVYLHMDKYKYPLLRDASQTAIKNMAERFEVSAYACGSLPELKRRVQDEEVTHVFISREEYCEDRTFFESLTDRLQVTMIIDRKFQQQLPESRILCISAPLYSLSIASILNEETVLDLCEDIHHNRFTAPDVHVLVVDDNLMNLKVVQGLLRPYRLQLSFAQSGQEALEKLRSKAFDFVFMDHMMPEMDGVETFRRIREKKDPYYQNLPIIALTANAVGNARDMFLSEGFADYVSKPIEMSAMEHVLHKFIPKEKMIYAGQDAPAPAAKNAASAPSGGKAMPGATPVSEKAPVPEASSPVPELSQAGFDVASGIGYCGGSLDDYLEIVRIYFDSGKKNFSGIQAAFDAGDAKQYTLLVHTLKSTSKSIGATVLFAQAAKMEAHARAEGLAGAGPDTKEMLAEYRRVLDAIAADQTVFPAGAPSADVPPADAGSAADPAPEAGAASDADAAASDADAAASALSKESFADCCRTLKDAIAAFDSDAVTTLADRYADCTYNGKPLSALLAPVFSAAADFDFIGAEEALARLTKGEGGDFN